MSRGEGGVSVLSESSYGLRDQMVMEDPVWRSRSACRGLPSDMFVTAGMTAEQEGIAKRVCSGCGVVSECLAYAIVHAVRYGVWGGLSAEERRPLRRQWLRDRASVTGLAG